MQHQMQQPQIAASSSGRVRSSYASRVPASVLRGHVIMGAIQTAVGCLVILLCIIGLANGSGDILQLIASGIWSGPFFIIAGVCGIVAGKGVKGCTLGCVITCLVFSIIASILGLVVLMLQSVFTDLNRKLFDDIKIGYYNWTTQPTITNEGAFRAVYATGIICILLFALEFVLAIVHAAYACRASCCCVAKAAPSRYQHQQVYLGQQVYYNGQSIAYPGQVVAANPGQQVSYVGQQPPAHPGQEGPGYPGQQPLPSYDAAVQQAKY